MNNFISLVIAGASMLAPHIEEQQVQRITLGGRAFFPGGKVAPSVSQRFVIGSTPVTWYVFTGKTLCEAQTVSSEKPAFAGNGWRVDIKPGPTGTVMVSWDKLWVGGKTATGGGTRPLTLGSGTPLVLDSIDGGARLLRQQNIERLKSVPTTDLRALSSIDGIDGIENGRTEAIRVRLKDLESIRKELIEVQRLGAMNVQVVHADAEIADSRKALQQELTANVARTLAKLQNNAPSESIDGCDALSMSLQITAEAAESTDATETEVWLVHKNPAGVETVQRQVVRSAGGNGSFVFDDLVIPTSRGPVTVEMHGGVRVLLGHGDGGQPWLVLDVNRRYVSSGTAFGWKTKEGGTGFAQNIRADEVLAFNLLPLKDDEGMLVGHRFSVRVRTKILK